MQKNCNMGFVLVETLIVTAFVSGVLLYLFIQLSNLKSSYDQSHSYNTINNLYALVDIIYYIGSDVDAYDFIKLNVESKNLFKIDDCSIFESFSTCESLINKENISKLYVSYNDVSQLSYDELSDEKLKKFIDHIHSTGIEKYRLIAKFNDDTFATIRFGE